MPINSLEKLRDTLCAFFCWIRKYSFQILTNNWGSDSCQSKTDQDKDKKIEKIKLFSEHSGQRQRKDKLMKYASVYFSLFWKLSVN